MSKKQTRALILSPVFIFFGILAVLVIRFSAFAQVDPLEGDNQPPQFNGPVQLQVAEASEQTILLSDYFQDPEGGELVYVAGPFKDFLGNPIGDGNLPDWLTLDAIGETLIASPKNGDAGAYIAEIEAFDPQANTVLGEVKIYVLVSSTQENLPGKSASASPENELEPKHILSAQPAQSPKIEILSAPPPASPPNWGGIVYKESVDEYGQGYFAIEAEDATARGSYGGYEFVEIPGPAGASGRGVVDVSPSGTFNFRSVAMGGPTLKFDLWFDEPGTYRVTLRGYQTGTASNYIDVSLDGVVVGDYSTNAFHPSGQYQWQGVSSGKLIVDEPGRHTVGLHLNYNHHSNDVLIDSVVIAESSIPADWYYPDGTLRITSPFEGSSQVLSGSGLPDQSAESGIAFSYAIPGGAFVDEGGGALEYELLEGPDWLSFDGTLFAGTPGEMDVGANKVRVLARNSDSRVAIDTFRIEVKASGEPSYGRLTHLEEDLPGETGGLFQISAEKYSHKVDVGGRSWEEHDYYGTAYMRTMPYDTAYDSGGDFQGAVLKYDLEFKSTGEYYLALLSQYWSSNGRIDVALDGRKVSTRLQSGQRKWWGDWRFTIDEPGVRTLSIHLREGSYDLYGIGILRGSRFSDWAPSAATLSGESPIKNAPYVDQGIADQQVVTGSLYNFALPATTFGGGNGSLTYAMLSGPSWLSFDGTTFSGTPSEYDYGINAVKVTATDELGLKTEQTFYVYVEFLVPPDSWTGNVFEWTADSYGEGYFAFEAEDATARAGYGGYEFVDSSTPSGASGGVSVDVSPSGSFNFTPWNTMIGPVLKYDLYFERAAKYHITIRARQTASNHNHYVVSLDGIKQDDDTREIGGTVGEFEWAYWSLYVDVDEPGLHTIGVHLNDDRWANGLQIDAIRVYDTTIPSDWYYPDGTLRIASPVEGSSRVLLGSGLPDQSAESGIAFSYAIPGGAFVDEGGGALEYELLEGPDWLSFDGTLFTGTPGEMDVGANKVRVLARNSDGRVAVDTFRIEVKASGEPSYGRLTHLEEDLPGETGGLFQISAEKYSHKVDVGGRSWEEHDYYGTAYMRTMPYDTAYDSGGDFQGAVLKYDLEFKSTGEYYLALLSQYWSSNGRIDVALDGRKVSTRLQSGQRKWWGDWRFTIDEPGVRTLSIHLREGSYDLYGIGILRGGRFSDWAPSAATLSGESPIRGAPYVDQGLADQQATTGSNISIQIPATAFAGGNGSMTYTIESGPAWLSLNGTTLTGTPTDADYGVNKIMIAAMDQLGLKATTSFMVNVAYATPPPDFNGYIHLEEKYGDGAYGPGGLFRIEAENYTAKHSYNSYSWEPYTGFANAGGGVSMRVNPTSSFTVNQNLLGPSLKFDLMFVDTGRYFITIRGQATSDGNSLDLSLDGQFISKRERHYSPYNQWEWESYHEFEIDKTGLHTLGLYLRNDGLTIDSIGISRGSGPYALDLLDNVSPLPATSPILGASPPSPVNLNQGVPDQTAYAGFPTNFSIPANAFTNQASGSLSYQAVTLPSWLSFDGTTFIGTPLEADVGTHEVKIKATNEEYQSAYDTFYVRVSPVAEPAYGRLTYVEEDLPGETGGLFQIDAMRYSHKWNVDDRAWEEYVSPSGTDRYMRTMPYDYNMTYDSGGDFAGPGLSYDLEFRATGEYYLSLLSERWSNNGRIDIALDGKKIYTRFQSTQKIWNGHTWRFTIDEPGVHSISIHTREGSYKLYAIGVLRGSNFSDWVPSANNLSGESPLSGSPYVDRGIDDAFAGIGETIRIDLPEDAFGGGNGSLSFSIESGPSWLSFDGKTFSGTVTDADYGVNAVTVVATDQLGLRASTRFDFLIYSMPANNPPLADQGIANQLAAQDSVFSLVLPLNAFLDPDGDPFTITPTALPAWLSFDGSTFSGTPSNDHRGLNTISLEVADHRSGVLPYSFSIDVANVNDAPVVDQGIPNPPATHEVAFSYAIPSDAFSDPDGDALTLTAVTLPSWLSFNGSTLSGTPQVSHIGGHEVTIQATDPSLQSVSLTFRILVSNEAPESADIPDTNLSVYQNGSGLIVDFSATDPEDGPIAITGSNVDIIQPTSGSVVWNSASGKYEYTPNSGFFGPSSFQYRVRDSKNEPSAWSNTGLRVVFDPGLDADGDSLPDGWEAHYGLDPAFGTGSHGANGNPDGDLFNNRLEYLFGANPHIPDTPTSQNVPISILEPRE